MPIALLHCFVEIVLHVLKHKIELVVLADDLFELDDVRVVELLERLQGTKYNPVKIAELESSSTASNMKHNYIR